MLRKQVWSLIRETDTPSSEKE